MFDYKKIIKNTNREFLFDMEDDMKKIIVLVITFVFLLTTIAPETMAQTRRKKYRGLPTNIAIVAGSTLAGALIGGKKGAALGAGGGLLYASSRKGMKRRYANSRVRRWSKVAGGSLLGAGFGAFAGKRGAAIGALAGAGATYLYTRNGRRYYRARNGRVYSVR